MHAAIRSWGLPDPSVFSATATQPQPCGSRACLVMSGPLEPPSRRLQRFQSMLTQFLPHAPTRQHAQELGDLGIVGKRRELLLVDLANLFDGPLGFFCNRLSDRAAG